jgi:phospholipid/cholesterol/gamma-HCH transport system substrate-binding protein
MRERRIVERDAKYMAVGLFALLAVAAAFAFVWWYSGASDRRSYARYEIHFAGTVSGLSQGSPVRYLGVDVGRVRSLSVDAHNAGQVTVVAEIDSSAPISGATRAKLGLLGLTGLLYIDLQQDFSTDPKTALRTGEKYPMIPSQKGDIEEFLERLPDAVTRAANVMMRIEQVLSDDNLASISATLANVQNAAGELPEIARQASTMTAEMREAAIDLRKLTSQLRAMTEATQPDLQASLASARETAENLSRTTASLEQIVAGNEAQLAQFAGTGVSEIQELVLDLRDATAEFRGLARSLREDPSQLIRSPPRGGVELPQ